MAVRLHHPHEFLDRVVEVEADLVGRRTNGFRTRVLELLNEVFVRVLGHAAAFIGVKVDVVHVERSRHEGVRVSTRRLFATGKRSNRP